MVFLKVHYETNDFVLIINYLILIFFTFISQIYPWYICVDALHMKWGVRHFNESFVKKMCSSNVQEAYGKMPKGSVHGFDCNASRQVWNVIHKLTMYCICTANWYTHKNIKIIVLQVPWLVSRFRHTMSLQEGVPYLPLYMSKCRWSVDKISIQGLKTKQEYAQQHKRKRQCFKWIEEIKILLQGPCDNVIIIAYTGIYKQSGVMHGPQIIPHPLLTTDLM